jgi:hypothetical protein
VEASDEAAAQAVSVVIAELKPAPSCVVRIAPTSAKTGQIWGTAAAVSAPHQPILGRGMIW